MYVGKVPKKRKRPGEPGLFQFRAFSGQSMVLSDALRFGGTPSSSSLRFVVAVIVSGNWRPGVLPALTIVGPVVPIVTVRIVPALFQLHVLPAGAFPHEMFARSFVVVGSESVTWMVTPAVLVFIFSLNVRVNASPASPKFVLPPFTVTCASVIVGGVAAAIAEKLTVCGLVALLPERSFTRFAAVELSW